MAVGRGFADLSLESGFASASPGGGLGCSRCLSLHGTSHLKPSVQGARSGCRVPGAGVQAWGLPVGPQFVICRIGVLLIFAGSGGAVFYGLSAS